MLMLKADLEINNDHLELEPWGMSARYAGKKSRNKQFQLDNKLEDVGWEVE